MNDLAMTFRLRLKVKDNEFEAEGTEEFVLSQLDDFKSMSFGKESYSNTTKDSFGEYDNPKVLDGIWQRVFRQKDELISLNVLPNTKFVNADSLILLIFVYQEFMGQNEVTSIQLMDSAKQSGLRIDRIDRNIPASHNQYLIRGGSGKGTRYMLNNRGLAYAREIMEQFEI